MAPIAESKVIPFIFRDSFSRDPCFTDCQDVIKAQKVKFENDCNVVREKVFGNSQLRSISLLAPSSLSDYVKPPTARNNNNSSQWIQANGINNNEKNVYKIILDVRQFTPNELSVWINPSEKNTITIDGRHQDKKEGAIHQNGFISRQFTRKCILPFDVYLDQIQCNLSSDGVLLIKVPKKMYFEIKNGKRELMTVDGRKLDESEVDLSRLDPKGNGYRHGFNNGFPSAKKTFKNMSEVNIGKRELMTIDGRKLDESEISNQLPRFVPKINGYSYNNGFTNGDNNSTNKNLNNWELYGQALPDFDMKPFWESRNDQSYQQQKNGLGIQSDLQNFKVHVDVKQFLPEEISVRCTNQFVIIEGKHEAKEDPYGFISRQFSRKFELPQGVKLDGMHCNLVSNGILEIIAPKPKAQSLNQSQTRQIPIVMTKGSIQPPQSNGMSIGPTKKPIRVNEDSSVYKYIVPTPAIEARPQKISNGHDAVDSRSQNSATINNDNVKNDSHAERTIIPFSMAQSAY